MLKKLWIDTETTGIDPKRNGLIEIGCFVEVANEVLEPYRIRIKPFPTDAIEDLAMEINGYPMDRSQFDDRFFDPLEAKKNFTAYLNQFVDPYKKDKQPNDKFIVYGWKVNFDFDFLREWFTKCGDRYFGSYFMAFPHKIVDVKELAKTCFPSHFLNETNRDFTLEKVAGLLGIEVIKEDLHSALVDVKLTYKVYKGLLERIRTGLEQRLEKEK